MTTIASLVFLPPGEPSGAEVRRAVVGQSSRRARLKLLPFRAFCLLVGTRGIPARYGGFETFAEELSTRLAARGHRVTVYCRERHPEPGTEASTCGYLPTIRHKYLDTLAHTLFSTLAITMPTLRRAAVLQRGECIAHLDSARVGDARRLKRRRLGAKSQEVESAAKTWYRVSEWLATWMPNAVVTDANQIAEYYQTRYRKPSTMIPYGAEIGAVQTSAELGKLGLEPRQYFLYVSRFEPENNPLLVRESFERVETPFKLALVGDAPYAGRLHSPCSRNQ